MESPCCTDYHGVVSCPKCVRHVCQTNMSCVFLRSCYVSTCRIHFNVVVFVKHSGTIYWNTTNLKHNEGSGTLESLSKFLKQWYNHLSLNDITLLLNHIKPFFAFHVILNEFSTLLESKARPNLKFEIWADTRAFRLCELSLTTIYP